MNEPPRKRWRITRARKLTGLGDAVALVAQPVARLVDGVLKTDIEHCKGCAGRQQWLNEKVPF